MDDSSTATIELRPSQVQHPTGNAIFRLPDFWQSNPSGWFHSVEAQSSWSSLGTVLLIKSF